MVGVETENFGRRYSSGFEWSGLSLGFGLGGFFDGILLHQVLQWHHLLSGVEQARVDVRILIMTDGLFHVLMYVIAGIGLVLLWRARTEFSGPSADRRMFANALIGFGVWHIIDSILSHWLLGIHRIRMDVDNPLLWDIVWFILFGIVPTIIGWMTRRNGPAGGRRQPSSTIVLVLAVGAMGPLSILPPSDRSQVIVLFRPDLTERDAVAAIAELDGRLIGSDSSGQLWAIDMGPDDNPLEFYRYGAMLVSNSMLPLGCFNWTKA